MLQQFARAVMLGVLTIASTVMAQEKIDPAAFEASLNFQQGKVVLEEQNVTLNLPSGYRFLGPLDAGRLGEAVGDVSDSTLIGTVVPPNLPLLGGNGLRVHIAYEKNGHVSDSDAASVGSAEVLTEVRRLQQKQAEKLKREGGSDFTFVGWAEAPRYDQAGHTLFWAEEFTVPGATTHPVMYHGRILGREGVVVLHAVVPREQLADIGAAMRAVAASASFNADYRYADFQGTVDRSSHYGLAAMVKGKAPRVSKMDRFWEDLRNFNLVSILIAIAACVFGVRYWRREWAKRFPAR